jgi:hypothetical protein
MFKLTDEEVIELMYLREFGFQYLVRNEIGSVEVFKVKPHVDVRSPGYKTWVERDYPMTTDEMRNRKGVSLGKYKFIEFKDEPMLIDDLISNYKIIISSKEDLYESAKECCRS